MAQFLIMDDSGRGFRTTVPLESFTTEEREYVSETDSEDADTLGIDPRSFGEWLDDCTIGDEYKNEERNFTVIRVS